MITQMQDTVYIHRCSHSSFQTLQILIFIIYVMIITMYFCVQFYAAEICQILVIQHTGF